MRASEPLSIHPFFCSIYSSKSKVRQLKEVLRPRLVQSQSMHQYLNLDLLRLSSWTTLCHSQTLGLLGLLQMKRRSQIRPIICWKAILSGFIRIRGQYHLLRQKHLDLFSHQFFLVMLVSSEAFLWVLLCHYWQEVPLWCILFQRQELLRTGPDLPEHCQRT